MKQLPKSILIKGMKHKIILGDNSKIAGLVNGHGKCSFGGYDPDNFIIYVDSCLPLDAQWAVLFHEFVHVFENFAAVKSLKNESTVEALGTEMMCLFREIGTLK
jgi:Zn-dependent peptidase ImmA (M78 family)